MWRVARQTLQMEDVDPLADPTPVVPTVAAAATAGGTKRIKANSVTDQMDDSEISLMSKTELDQAHIYHIEMTGAEPAEEAEPTGEQVSAMRDRIVTRGESPYADFSILTPYGRTMQKQLKARSWILQQDGTFKALEVPGPPSFEAWQACWKVFRSILFMLRYPPPAAGGAPLRVVTQACLEEYFEKISKLNLDHPEAWHLLMRAEDKCRSEQFERYRRQLTKAAAENRLPMGLDFNPLQPWTGVFTHAARHREFWQEHVVGPAMLFIARGRRQISVDAAQSMRMTEPAQAALSLTTPSTGKKRKKPGQGAGQAASHPPPEPHPTPRPAKKDQKKSGEHPQMWGKHYVTTAEGQEICFRFSKGTKGGECEEPCRDNRAHVCQFCLGKHPNFQCDQRNRTGGKSSGKSKNKN
eukprot:Skav210032  [mRNA]  locus=scaffold706:72092:73324:+ [translate_table: standard]